MGLVFKSDGNTYVVNVRTSGVLPNWVGLFRPPEVRDRWDCCHHAVCIYRKQETVNLVIYFHKWSKTNTKTKTKKRKRKQTKQNKTKKEKEKITWSLHVPRIFEKRKFLMVLFYQWKLGSCDQVLLKSVKTCRRYKSLECCQTKERNK